MIEVNKPYKLNTFNGFSIKPEVVIVNKIVDFNGAKEVYYTRKSGDVSHTGLKLFINRLVG